MQTRAPGDKLSPLQIPPAILSDFGIALQAFPT
jgi:hypothetical protein